MQKNREKARNEQALSAITQNKVVTLPTKKLNTAILMEQIKHECGVAMVRLLQPLSYYKEKYGTWMYGLNKLYLMMEKQHNRGQEAAGLAALKLQAQPGDEFMFRERAQGNTAIQQIFSAVHSKFSAFSQEQLADVDFAGKNIPFAGEIYMGHLRYSTTGKSGLSYVHPLFTKKQLARQNLCLCANFNMTNVPEIFSAYCSEGTTSANVERYVSLVRATRASS